MLLQSKALTRTLLSLHNSRDTGDTAASFFGLACLKVAFQQVWCDAHLAGALGAAIHGPFIFVLVFESVVDANSTGDVHLIFQQRAVLRLEGNRGREREFLRTEHGKVSLCQSSDSNESLTDSVIKTSPCRY